VAIRQARKTSTIWPCQHNNRNRYVPGCPAQNISVCGGVGVLRRRWVTFGKCLTGKGASPTNQCWCWKTRVIAVSCGIKISAVHHLVLSQYMHLTDRRTELRQQYRALHYMQSCSKNYSSETDITSYNYVL